MEVFVRGQQGYSVKGQGVHSSGFVGETVSVTTTQLSPWRADALMMCKRPAGLSSNKTLFTRTGSREDVGAIVC